MDRRSFLGLTGASVASLAAAKDASAADRQNRPNFILVFADDLGYGDLSCYGHPTIRTPNLDRMAQEGIRLTSFYAAASVCSPSRAGLLTGRYPVRCGQPGNLGPGSTGGLPLSEVILPAALKPLGYRTMAIGKWHLGHTPDYVPTARGFDSFYGLPYSNDMIPPWVKTDKPLHLYRDTESIESPVQQETLTERYTEEAVKFIRRSRGSPFFLYLPHSMPHLPISTSRRFRARSRAGLYGDVIEALDWSMGRILATLKQQRLDRRTMVIFTSDNGPWLNLPTRMLQEGNERWHAGSKGLLRGHKGNTYEGGLRVPGIVRWPGRIPPGQISEDIAATLDLYTTIVQAAGADLPADRTLDGKDLMPFLAGKAPSPRQDFYYFRGSNLEAVREGKWKLRLSRSMRDDLEKDDPLTPELFDLDFDPAEQYNLADREPDLVTRLHEKLRTFAQELNAKLAEPG